MMPWNCSICAVFAADDIKILLNHIGRCHRNDPNFHCICGLNGCTKTFKKYYSWRKHIKMKNDNSLIENSDLPAMDTDIPDMPNPAEINDTDGQVNVTKSSALYLLKLQEECYLPKSTVKSVLENTKTIVQETLSVVKTHVEQCLTNNDVDPKNIPGLQDIFVENNAITNPFYNLETETQQKNYYKENFNLKVAILLY